MNKTLCSLNKIIVAIDGHSSCGKSTLAKDLANSLNYLYIDSGAMYRAVTLYLLQNDLPFDQAGLIEQALGKMQITFRLENDGPQTLLNGQNVEQDIRQMTVSRHVSQVSALSVVRRNLVARQQAMGMDKGIVMDGRDIGTVVFPEAELKIFLTADIEVRAQRRYRELLGRGIDVDLEAVTANLIERDHIDSTRTDSPLKKAADAVVIDNSNLSREEQLMMISELARLRIR